MEYKNIVILFFIELSLPNEDPIFMHVCTVDVRANKRFSSIHDNANGFQPIMSNLCTPPINDWYNMYQLKVGRDNISFKLMYAIFCFQFLRTNTHFCSAPTSLMYYVVLFLYLLINYMIYCNIILLVSNVTFVAYRTLCLCVPTE